MNIYKINDKLKKESMPRIPEKDEDFIKYYANKILKMLETIDLTTGENILWEVCEKGNYEPHQYQSQEIR